ncbi:hypothetical protein EJ03DRAFT_327990 [Teratosphaeria nubilosa]|uniref:Uncharacterized protein n=1 Tax=Teratosphaeria nubilosa TaxID=161662 RepID=A0A6G1L8H7_9PEZI|nr:hypothetical protein EJ03DRAFT_327990 [Teratosphaeria nubilosa]
MAFNLRALLMTTLALLAFNTSSVYAGDCADKPNGYECGCSAPDQCDGTCLDGLCL